MNSLQGLLQLSYSCLSSKNGLISDIQLHMLQPTENNFDCQNGKIALARKIKAFGFKNWLYFTGQLHEKM